LQINFKPITAALIVSMGYFVVEVGWLPQQLLTVGTN